MNAETKTALTASELAEGNKLIAEFMGGKKRWFLEESGKTIKVSDHEFIVGGQPVPKHDIYYSTGKNSTNYKRLQKHLWELPNNKMGHHDNWLKYNSSWDWLMPVIDKIFNYQYEDGDTAFLRTIGMENPDTGQKMVRFNRQSLFQADTFQEAAFMAVVDFIKWFNTQSTNPIQ